MSFTCHDVLLVLQVPDLPSAIITCCGHNLLLGMKGHATNTFAMGSKWLLARKLVVDAFELFRKVWIWSSILWPWSIRSLNLNSSLFSSTHSLLSHACIDLLLDSLFMALDLTLDISNLLL